MSITRPLEYTDRNISGIPRFGRVVVQSPSKRTPESLD